MTAPEPQSVQVPVLWVGVDEEPVVMVNQYLGQVQEDEVILTFGTVTPPVLLGSSEEIQKQIDRLGYVPVRTAIRMSLTRTRLDQLIKVLATTADTYDRAHPGSQ